MIIRASDELYMHEVLEERMSSEVKRMVESRVAMKRERMRRLKVGFLLF